MPDDFAPRWRITEAMKPADLAALGKEAEPMRIEALSTESLVKIRVPNFQRSLVWSAPKRQEFFESLQRGWPFGIVTLADVGSDDGPISVRVFRIIDGLQRLSSLWQFRSNFLRFYRPSDEDVTAANQIVAMLGGDIDDVDVSAFLLGWLSTKKDDAEQFESDTLGLLVALATELGQELDLTSIGDDLNAAIRALLKSIARRRDQIDQISIPVQVIGMELQRDLAAVFDSLNSGLRLSKYDLLAATLDSLEVDLTRFKKADRKALLDHANKRFARAVDEGYEVEEYTDNTTAISLYDYLYARSSWAEGLPGLGAAGTSELAFQVAALLFSQTLRGLNDSSPRHLANVFPRLSKLEADVTAFDQAFREGAKAISETLKQFTGWSLQRGNLPNPLGLIQAASYIASYVALTWKVEKSKTQPGAMSLRARSAAKVDKDLQGYGTITRQKRADEWRQHVRWWFLLDNLRGAFVGSDAYENAEQRVWSHVGEGGEEPEPSPHMLVAPPVDAFEQPLRELIASGLAVSATPQRRVPLPREAATLMRVAFSDLSGRLSKATIEHVYPLKWINAALEAEAIGAGNYPLNHFGNIAFVGVADNSGRRDKLFPAWLKTKAAKERKQAATRLKPVLLVEPMKLGDENTRTEEDFEDFLVRRSDLIIQRALRALAEGNSALTKNTDALTRRVIAHFGETLEAT